jgi:hypothetical protein
VEIEIRDTTAPGMERLTVKGTDVQPVLHHQTDRRRYWVLASPIQHDLTRQANKAGLIEVDIAQAGPRFSLEIRVDPAAASLCSSNGLAPMSAYWPKADKPSCTAKVCFRG